MQLQDGDSCLFQGRVQEQGLHEAGYGGKCDNTGTYNIRIIVSHRVVRARAPGAQAQRGGARRRVDQFCTILLVYMTII